MSGRDGLLIFVEIGPPDDKWPWWKPGWFSQPCAGRRFRRAWWCFFAVAWIRGDLIWFHEQIATGRIGWRK